MNILELYLKSKIKSQNQKGFTLIELLVAIVMASVVLVGLGSGLVALLSSSNTSAAKNDLKDQLSRAADYLNEDLKRSRITELEVTDIDGDGSDDQVLKLTYFDNLTDTTPKTIRYFLAASSNPWRGPNVLMRLEDTDGDNDPSNNTPQVLVDGLTENASTIACNVGTDVTRLDSGGGFQACITKATSNSGADLYRTNVALIGEINDITGSDANSKVLDVDTDTIARSVSPSLDPPVIESISETYSLTPSLVWEFIDGATSYEVYSCSTTDPVNNCDNFAEMNTGTDFGSPPDGKDVQHDVAPGPTDNNRECYAVKAVNSDGTIKSDFSNSVCTIINPSSVPTAVLDVDFTVSDAIQPAVNSTYDSDAIEYKIYRCQTGTAADDGSVTPCTPAIADGSLVYSFFAASSVEFASYLPWSDSEIPNEDTAFCYSIVKLNEEGASAASTAKCGGVNATLEEKSDWLIEFDTFSSGVSPDPITWSTTSGAPAEAIEYELRRCTTTTDCDPETENDVIIIENGSSNSFSEGSEPAEEFRFCYAVRGKTPTQVSPFSTHQCAEISPKICTLNMRDLGLGLSPTGSDISTSENRDALKAIVTDAEFTNLTSQNTPDPGSTGLGLYQVNADGTNARELPGGVQDFIDLACSTPIEFLWEFTADTNVNAPVITSDLSGSTKPTVTWDLSEDPQGFAEQYTLYECELTAASPATACTEANATIVLGPGTTRTYRSNSNPADGKKFCYGVKALDTDTNIYSVLSTIECGAVKSRRR